MPGGARSCAEGSMPWGALLGEHCSAGGQCWGFHCWGSSAHLLCSPGAALVACSGAEVYFKVAHNEWHTQRIFDAPRSPHKADLVCSSSWSMLMLLMFLLVPHSRHNNP